MRAIWKGSIAFGLVTIPIALYSAVRSNDLKFRMLRAKDRSPIHYKKVAETDGKEVSSDEIVKGFEYDKGKFVVLKEEDFDRVDVEATQTVDIVAFVNLEEINPIFFSKPYYIEPQKGGEKAYTLLRDALHESDKAGIAKVVIKTRQYLAAVKPNENYLVLEVMHFADELQDPAELHVPRKISVGKNEMKMATTLIEQMTEKWDAAQYKDEYREALLQVIQEKAKTGGKGIPAAKSGHRPATNVIDLMDVLQKSLAETQKKTRKSAKTKHKKAA